VYSNLIAMNVLRRSWKLTKLTFSVINKERELLVFALLSFVFSSLFAVAMIYPAVLPYLTDTHWSQETQLWVQLGCVFATYFGLAFIATFFNVCVVFTAKTRFEGGNATFLKSLSFAFSRWWRIVQWSLVSATVGLVLHLLQQAAQKLGKVGAFVGNIVTSLLGMAWSVLTLFVVPVLVYEDKGPFASIRRSVEVIRKTWGESLVKGIGLGLVQFLTYLLLTLVIAASAYGLYEPAHVLGSVAVVGVGLLLFLLAALVFSVANTVFNTALYVFAESGKVADGFDSDLISDAVRTAKAK